MLNWLWVRVKAMHWAAKLFSVVFLVQAGVYLAQAYQITHLKVPAFNELRRVEGKLILVKQRRDWLTGVEHPDGSRELFTCQWPGGRKTKFCFMRKTVEKFKLDTMPEVILWWYPMTAPLEDRIYPYIFQMQMKNENQPFRYPISLGRMHEFSYKEYTPTSTDVRGKYGMAILYALGVVFLFMWESYKYSTRKE